MSSVIELSRRRDSLSWTHHSEVASIKTIETQADGSLSLSDETDYEKIEELLIKAEKESLSVKELRYEVRKHKEEQQEYMRLANARLIAKERGQDLNLFVLI